MQLLKSEIPTPALLVDLDLFEANLTRAAGEAAAAGKHLRPHFKAHKCIEIARRQILAGARGVCAATVREAELLASAGMKDVLLTSPLADPLKIARLVTAGSAAGTPAGIMAVVDNLRQVRWFQEAAEARNSEVALLVDLDVGDHRTGAATLQDLLEIAQAISEASHLRLRGVQAYSVAGAHGKDKAERARLSSAAFRLAADARDALAARGLHTDLLTGGSTGTWDVDLAVPEVNELQAGTYPLMDLQYRGHGSNFQNAATVMATVISANHPGFATVDAGFKAFSTDRTFGPEPLGFPGATYTWAGDEFGRIDVPAGCLRPKLGDRVEFLPPHCDPTVNLYDRIYACRGQFVEDIWSVMDRYPALQPGVR